MNNTSYDALKSRAHPLVQTAFSDVKRPGVYEGYVVSIGPRDQELKTARVYIPILNQVMNCSNNGALYSSDKGIGTYYGLYAGDRVKISFLNSDPNTPIIVGSMSHTAGLADNANKLDKPNTVKTPLSNIPVAAEWGFAMEYVQVLGATL
jgi:hypothetical protein